jgi:hypothetical protein
LISTDTETKFYSRSLSMLGKRSNLLVADTDRVELKPLGEQ